jgi:hypothetical protein
MQPDPDETVALLQDLVDVIDLDVLIAPAVGVGDAIDHTFHIREGYTHRGQASRLRQTGPPSAKILDLRRTGR